LINSRLVTKQRPLIERGLPWRSNALSSMNRRTP
jgi:hypothetical protein